MQYFLIENSGEHRQMWGPFPLALARRKAGARHVVVTGDGMHNGQIVTRGALRAALQSRRINPTGGASRDAIA